MLFLLNLDMGMREHLRKFAEAGVDQTVFIQQGGKNRHEHICEALELFAGEVMPEFKANEAERQAKKAEELAPYVEAAFKRKEFMKELTDDEIETYRAYGFAVAEEDISHLPESQQRRALAMRKMREVALSS